MPSGHGPIEVTNQPVGRVVVIMPSMPSGHGPIEVMPPNS